jgi:hypothetical protein
MVHILALASIRGLIVRGPATGRDQAFVLARDWLGTPPPGMSREAALGELARRYLAGHAPATPPATGGNCPAAAWPSMSPPRGGSWTRSPSGRPVRSIAVRKREPQPVRRH